MTPTETLAKLLEESGAQVVLPNEDIRKAFAALEAENAELRRKLAEYESVDDTPAELQMNCATFTDQAVPRETITIGKDLYAELREDRERLDADMLPVGTRVGLDGVRLPNGLIYENLRAAIDAARKAGA